MRFAFIDRRREEFEVERMCEMLGVSRSGYYAWRDRRDRREPCVRQQRRVELTGRIRQVHQHSRGTYGSPRVTVELNDAGVEVCENTVARYMRDAGICVQPRRSYVPRTTDSDHGHPVAANLLARDFAASAPNRKWACDLTYIFTDEGWLYLSVVLDLFSRRVIGWSMTDHLRSEAVAEALKMAIARRRPGPELLHHSDRGVQYACESYRHMLDEHATTCSMSRTGNC